MVRGPFYDKNGVKKGAWSKEEDECLSDYIHKHGHSNWRQLPKLAGLTRCGKSCRLRWLNYLKPNLKHGNYTREEDEMIIKLHHHFGNKWSLIAEKLPGRTDHEIKNYWHSYLKKCLKGNENTMLDLKLKPCDNVEENDTQHSVTPKSPISNVGKDFHYILESSTLPPMLAAETSPENNYLSSSTSPMHAAETSSEDNYSPSSTLPMLAAETSPEDNYSPTETSPKDNYSPSSTHSRGIEEDNVAQWLTFESFSGDFWTEPFIIEDTYTTNEISNEDIDFLISDFYDGSYVF